MAISGFSQIQIAVLVFLITWESAWKGIALWKAGRNNHLKWFIAIFIFNTIGILPIIYIFIILKKRKAAARQN